MTTNDDLSFYHEVELRECFHAYRSLIIPRYNADRYFFNILTGEEHQPIWYDEMMDILKMRLTPRIRTYHRTLYYLKCGLSIRDVMMASNVTQQRVYRAKERGEPGSSSLNTLFMTDPRILYNLQHVLLKNLNVLNGYRLMR